MLLGAEMMLTVEIRMGLGKQIGLVMKMGFGILVCMKKTFHLLATKYEHVYSVSY